MSFGERLKKFRTEKEMTQEELGNALSISPQAVSKWEREECMPDAAMLPRIADILDVSLDRLFERGNTSRADLMFHLHNYTSELRGGLGYIPKGMMARLQEITHMAGFAASMPSMPKDLLLDKFPLWKREESGASFVVETNSGFIYASNRAKLPFFAIFPEPEDGWKAELTETQTTGRILTLLADGEVRRTLFTLYEQKEPDFTFDDAYAAQAYGLTDPGTVLEKLAQLYVLSAKNAVIDGAQTRIWRFRRSCGWIAVFTVLQELIFHKGDKGDYSMQHSERTAPYFR